MTSTLSNQILQLQLIRITTYNKLKRILCFWKLTITLPKKIYFIVHLIRVVIGYYL